MEGELPKQGEKETVSSLVSLLVSKVDDTDKLVFGPTPKDENKESTVASSKVSSLKGRLQRLDARISLINKELRGL